jgi:aminoglycoside 3-N-acetyltransferase
LVRCLIHLLKESIEDLMLKAEDILNQFTSLNYENSDIVVIYSGIWMIGANIDLPPKDVPVLLLDCLCEYADRHHKTILLPSYTYNFTKTKKFDLAKSKPETGVLAEFALSKEGFRRTSSPLNSYLAYGPRKEEILAVRDETLWGDSSLMGWLDDEDANIWVLGEPWHRACTHFHRAEEVYGVEYRYYKRFRGELFNNGIFLAENSSVMHVRPKECKSEMDFSCMAPEMERRSHVKSSTNQLLPLEAATARKIVEVGMDLLNKDEYCFVVNKSAYRNWANQSKTEEIRSLSKEEAYIRPSDLSG